MTRDGRQAVIERDVRFAIRDEVNGTFCISFFLWIGQTGNRAGSVRLLVIMTKIDLVRLL